MLGGSVERGGEGGRTRAGVAGREEERVPAVVERLGNAADASGDHGHARKRRLDADAAESLVGERRDHHGVRALQQPAERFRLERPASSTLVRDAQLRGEALDPPSHRRSARACQHQPCRPRHARCLSASSARTATSAPFAVVTRPT